MDSLRFCSVQRSNARFLQRVLWGLGRRRGCSFLSHQRRATTSVRNRSPGNRTRSCLPTLSQVRRVAPVCAAINVTQHEAACLFMVLKRTRARGRAPVRPPARSPARLPALPRALHPPTRRSARSPAGACPAAKRISPACAETSVAQHNVVWYGPPTRSLARHPARNQALPNTVAPKDAYRCVRKKRPFTKRGRLTPPAPPKFNVGRWGAPQSAADQNGRLFRTGEDAQKDAANNIELGGRRGLARLRVGRRAFFSHTPVRVF